MRRTAFTDGVVVSPAEQAIWLITVLQTGRHTDEMTAGGVEASVDDLYLVRRCWVKCTKTQNQRCDTFSRGFGFGSGR